jgi:hypothetical protein
MITPLYKIPLPTEVNLEELYVKYIQPYVWEGELWLDGGWGPKNSIQDLISDDPIQGFKVPFLVSPVNHIDFDTSKESNRRYTVAFPGEQWKLLVNFIEAVKGFGVEEQVYVLNSYFSTNLPEEGAQIYQLHIVARQDSTTIHIEKGKWVPSFDESLVVAGW